MNLEKYSSDELRKIWYEYDEIPDYIFDMVYVNWLSKYPVQNKYKNVENKLRVYAKSNSIEKLRLRGLSSKDRLHVHDRCNSYGFEHKSENEEVITNTGKKKKSKVERVLVIWKPEKWCWEHTETDSGKYVKPKRYYKRRVKYCDNCGASSDDAELLISPYGFGPYCEDCIETMSDGQGGEMSGHKFEPVF